MTVPSMEETWRLMGDRVGTPLGHFTLKNNIRGQIKAGRTQRVQMCLPSWSKAQQPCLLPAGAWCWSPRAWQRGKSPKNDFPSH